MAKKKSLVIQIKGIDWTVFVQSNVSYIREHGKDSAAVTYTAERQMYFNSSYFNPGYIRHELLHAYVASSGITSSNLDTDQIEELCAEIIEEHYFEIGTLTDKITNFILG